MPRYNLDEDPAPSQQRSRTSIDTRGLTMVFMAIVIVASLYPCLILPFAEGAGHAVGVFIA